MATMKKGKEPGVYVQEVVNPALSINEARLKVAGLVGHAAPTLVVRDISVTRSDDSLVDTMSDYGADFVQEVLCVSQYSGAYKTNLPQYTQYEESGDVDADYDVSGNEIIWLDPEKAPAAGTSYYVTAIIKKDPSYYVPKMFADINSVKEFYGPEFYKNELGENELNEITLAARLMFTNGADQIWICEAPKVEESGESVPSAEKINAAIDLMSDIEIQSLVVTYQTPEIQAHIKDHVVICSATENGKERVGFLSTLVGDKADDIVSACKSFHEQRIVYVVPTSVTILAENEAGEAQEFKVSSIYAAAAAVGLLTDNSRLVSEPLTRKTLAGLYGVSTVYSRADIEKMSAAGAFILKTDGATVTVNQAVTTDISNQNNRELSVVLIKDEVIKELRYNLDRDYIGHAYNRKTTPTKMKTSIVTILNEFLDTLIEGYDESDVVVLADPNDTTRVNVTLSFAVLRPLNYIYISFMVTL